MIFRLLAVVALAVLPACHLVLGAECPDLEDCNLDCDNLQQGRDGCSICACETPDPGPVVCWDDSECATGQRCDTVSFCDKAPNCVDGQPCPDACYGECVAAPATCLSDADCPSGSVCAVIDNAGGANDRPSGGGGSDAPVPAPSGVCVDATCGQTGSVALPECPPGSEPAFDGCNATCVAVDACRSLLPDQCAVTAGCQIIDEPCGCNTDPNSTNGCDCADTERCVAVDDCASLDATSCESNPSCVLKPIGSGDSSGGTGGAPAPPCDSNDPSCAQPCDPTTGQGCNTPPPDVVCVPRSTDGTCLSDADCFAGETCSLTTLCGSGCATNPDGTQNCFDQCWTDRGTCLAGTGACASLAAADCTSVNGCELVDETPPATCTCDAAGNNCDCADQAPIQVCLPISTQCTVDTDCGDGRHCVTTESCPACDPTNGGDLNCAAPCFVEGTCVDGAPPPVTCNSDADCGDGSCVAVNVCDTCGNGTAPPPGPGDQPAPAPPPCDPACVDENVCVGQAPPPPTPCRENTDCGTDQRCATELQEPVCVDGGGSTSGTFCLDNSQCDQANGETCHFNANVCPADASGACQGWCDGACADVVTSAQDPSTGQCVVFNDTCIPPGWQTVATCSNTPPPP